MYIRYTNIGDTKMYEVLYYTNTKNSRPASKKFSLIDEAKEFFNQVNGSAIYKAKDVSKKFTASNKIKIS
jgi:hypothetical protein